MYVLCSKAKQLRIVLGHGMRPDFFEMHLLYEIMLLASQKFLYFKASFSAQFGMAVGRNKNKNKLHLQSCHFRYRVNFKFSYTLNVNLWLIGSCQ